MDISSVNSDLIRGNVTTIILGCLKDSDKYGYEILKEIDDKSYGHYTLKQATLYNLLKRLEKQGLISSYEGTPDDTNGGKRRYYSLTVDGKNYLVKERDEYEYARTILDKLVSDDEFDFSKQIPFDASELRPYSKRDSSSKSAPTDEQTTVVYQDRIVEKPVEKIVYQDRIVEKPVYQDRIIEKPTIVYQDKIVEVEKNVPVPVYYDVFGKEITKEEIEDAKEKAALLDCENQKIQEKYNDAMASIDILNTEKAGLISTLEALRAEQQSKGDKLSSIESEKNELQLKLDESLAKIDEINARIEELEHEKEELNLKLASSEQESVSYQDVIRTKNEENETALELLRSRLEDSENEKIGVTNSLNSLQTEYDALQKDYVKLSDDYNALSEELRAAEEQKKVAYSKPAMNAEELFSKLELRSEYDGNQELASDAYAAGYVESELITDGSTDGEQPVAAIIPKQKSYDYENVGVNYGEFFNSIIDTNAALETPQYAEKPDAVAQPIGKNVKEKLYAKGFKVRTYDKTNTTEYYSLNFIHANKINRDTFLVVLAVFLVEMAIFWCSLYDRISYKYFIPVVVIGTALCLIPTVLYFVNPTKRVRANFSFKLSILNRTMLFIELTLICVLIGFFALGATVNDVTLIIASMVIPLVIFLNLPISSVIYYLFYRSKKYHVA